MVTTDKTVTETAEKEIEGQAKQRTRINPRVKMVKALHSILGEQLRENDLMEAAATVEELAGYLKELNDD